MTSSVFCRITCPLFVMCAIAFNCVPAFILFATEEVVTAATGLSMSELFTHQIGFFLLSCFGWNHSVVFVGAFSFCYFLFLFPTMLLQAWSSMAHSCTGFFSLLWLCVIFHLHRHICFIHPFQVSVISPVTCLLDFFLCVSLIEIIVSQL